MITVTYPGGEWTTQFGDCGGFGQPYCREGPWNHFSIQPGTEGSMLLIATSEGVSDTAFIAVGPRREVAWMTVEPSFTRMLVYDSVTLLATLRDANGTAITWANGGLRPVTWTSDNPVVATVDSGGGEYSGQVVTAVGVGSATITATSEGVSSAATITVQPLVTFASVSAGGQFDYSETYGDMERYGHTCGVATDGAAYCWGSNNDGSLGDGSYSPSVLPTAVSGGLTFASVSAGRSFTCGLTTSGAGYCWGGGVGAPPASIFGGLTFVALSVGSAHYCGVTAEGIAYCWGENQSGPVGGTEGLGFVSISAGDSHICGLTAAGAAYCWGHNGYGQLSDGSTTDQWVPTAVSGGHRFVALAAGHQVSCGLITTGAAYCWGYNAEGAVGDGSTTHRSSPVAVSGGLSFVALTAGDGAANVCGLTATGAAYCWGYNNHGALGDGSATHRSVPTAVLGGLTFSSVSAGGHHTCAVTTTAIAYCWGRDYFGPLSGFDWYSPVPVKVPGQP